ncbi:hypothetical protein ACP275_05G007300 [Erythranthe tilingii]
MNTQLQRRSFFLVVVVSILLLWKRVESIRFDLESGHTKCISEDINTNSMTVGNYKIVNHNEGHPLPDSHQVTVRVTSAYGNNYHSSDNVKEGHFGFQAVEAGDYMACFFATASKPSTTMTVDFDWKSGVAAKDWSNVAKKDSVDLMEIELKKLVDAVQSIHEEIFYLRAREHEMQNLNKSTNSKMTLLSFLSLFISMSVAGLQFWHLKSFFQKKKLI